MPETPKQHTSEAADTPQESKALRLARYLREFVGLRSSTVRDVDKYEMVLWLADMPQEAECQSPAWNDDCEPGDPWLEVRKQQFPKPPEPPEVIDLWIDQQEVRLSCPAPILEASSMENACDLPAEKPVLARVLRHLWKWPPEIERIAVASVS